MPLVENPASKLSFDNTSIAFASKNNAQLRKMYLLFWAMNNPILVKFGTAFLRWAFKWKLPVKGLVKHTVFEHFCGGETIQECAATIQELAKFKIGTILDYSVEGEKSEASFEATAHEIIRTIEKAASQPQAIPFAVFKVTGIAAFELLEKIQKAQPLHQQEQQSWQNVQQRMQAICKRAYELKVKLLVDGEETWIQDTIDRLTYQMMEEYNKQECIIYNTYQLYRSDMLENLKGAYQVASQKGYWLGAKLVRGAYMEKESRRAAELNYPDPIQPSKEAADRDFNEAVKFCVEHLDKIGLCSGTHNQYSNQYLAELMQHHEIPVNDPRVYFAQLYGMSDNISYALANAGYNVAKYVPYGPVEAVMPYLFRRAAENTSIAGQSSREFSLIQKEIKRRKKSRA